MNSGIGMCASHTVFFLLLFASPSWGQVEPTPTPEPDPYLGRVLNYQGRLAGPAAETTLQFSLHDALTGGNVLWGPETQVVVPDSAGVFTTVIGSSRRDVCRRYIDACSDTGEECSGNEACESPATCNRKPALDDETLCCPWDAECEARPDGVPDLDQIDDPANVYLEVGVEAGGTRETLSPRQRIFPAFHANTATSAVFGEASQRFRDGAVVRPFFAADAVDHSEQLGDGDDRLIPEDFLRQPVTSFMDGPIRVFATQLTGPDVTIGLSGFSAAPTCVGSANENGSNGGGRVVVTTNVNCPIPTCEVRVRTCILNPEGGACDTRGAAVICMGPGVP